VSAIITKLDAAETATKTRTHGTVQARNEARVQAVHALHALKGYVQQVADANPDQAESIIASAAMGSKRKPARSKAPLAVKPGTSSGSVRVAAKAAAHRASYEWQWSGDGGKTWTPVPSTLQSKTTIAGLPTATNCQFRYRALTRTGAGDWSQTVTVLVK
jgi:hypothetical protein